MISQEIESPRITVWHEFCKNAAVPKKYRDASLKKLCSESTPDGIEIAKSFTARPFSMLMMGDAGRGKTYYLYAIIKALLLRGLPLGFVRFINAADLQNKIDEEVGLQRCGNGIISSLCDTEILFLDDFGVERSGDVAERNYYTLLDKRLSNDMPTIISTNLTDEEITKVFGIRIFSRLKQCLTVNFSGPDLRTL